MSVEITEFVEIDPDSVHAVFKAANGTPFLMIKQVGDDDDADDKGGKPDDDEDDKAEKAEFCGDPTCEVCVGRAAKGKLKMSERRRIPKGDFALPEKAPASGSYPINDRAHARAALRMRGHASPEDQARIKRAVAAKYPDLGQSKKERKKLKKAAAKKASNYSMPGQEATEQAAHGDVPSPSAQMGQTNANYRKQARMKSVTSDRPSGQPKSLEAGNINAEGEGFGDTAPDKEIHREEAGSQTAERVGEEKSRQSASKGVNDVDMKGNSIEDRPTEIAGREQTQTEANMRHEASGGDMIRDQMTRQNEQAQKGFKFKVKKTGKKKRKKNAPHELSGALKQSDPQRVISWPHATKELESMTVAEFMEALDARDARKAEEKRAKKEARDAKKAKKAKKAEKKAAKQAQRTTAGGTEEGAADASKSMSPELLVDGVAERVSSALKEAVKPLADRIHNLENQPARPRLAINQLAGKAPEMRDQVSTGRGPMDVLKPLEDAFKAEKNPYEKEKLGGELTKARLVIRERLAHGQPVSAADAEALAAVGK